jgi:hypothetical protein
MITGLERCIGAKLHAIAPDLTGGEALDPEVLIGMGIAPGIEASDAGRWLTNTIAIGMTRV